MLTKELSPNLSSVIDFSSLYLDGFDIFLILSQRPPQHESLPPRGSIYQEICSFYKCLISGTIGESYTMFDKPMTPGEIQEAIYTKVQPFNTISAVLQQELILYCGKLIQTNPELFSGILVVRMG